MLFEFEILARIVIALLCGGIIGYEREKKNMPAGLRTHILVCIGAALVMVVSQYIYEQYAPGTVDPTRMGAQVISGIGFLGAGTIIRERFSVRGLTTAATLWVVACIGLAVGSGYYLMGGIVTLIIFATLILFRKLEGVMQIKSAKAKIKITAYYSENTDKEISEILKQAGYRIMSMRFSKSMDKKRVEFTYEISCKDEKIWRALSETLYKNKNIIKADIEY